ncbi:DUF952 domain-containing protein [Arthrobacter sp. NPDC056691]|uniref:DUF952 domain-containing protein n=1 Tax=Arthrobacter sp. NPDC056691 TaxID=3345913 RepID=UPI00366BFD73
MSGERLLHVAITDDWEACARFGEYDVSTRGKTIDDAGFIHAATGPQLRTVLDEVFGGLKLPLLAVVVDEDALAAAGVEVRWDASHRPGEEFAAVPRILGPIPMEEPIIVATFPLELQGDRWPALDLHGLGIRTILPT